MACETLKPPVEIAPNLNAGVRVGDAWVTCGYADRQGDERRVRYRWEIIFGDGTTESDDDLQSGNPVRGMPNNLTSGLASLLSFLSACGESYGYNLRTGREGENTDLFSPRVAEFAYQYSDELSMLCCDIEESDDDE